MVRTLALLLSILYAASCYAAIFTVTSDGTGTHATIQAAIDAAISAGGANEIRVASGTYHERAVIGAAFTGALDLTGGWSAGFRERSFDESRTVVDGDGIGPVLYILINIGRVSVTGFTFVGADSVGPGGALHQGGISVHSTGNAVVRIEDVALQDNHLIGTAHDPARGGGFVASIEDQTSLFFLNNKVRNNSATAVEDQTATGGGAYITVTDNGHALIRGNEFTENTVRAPEDQAQGSGLFLGAGGEGRALLLDNKITDNIADTPSELIGWAGVVLVSAGTGVLEARRNEIRRNTGEEVDVYFEVFDSGRTYFSDSLVADNSHGVGGDMVGPGSLFITNCTIASNTGPALTIGKDVPEAYLAVSNTLVFGNGTDTPFLEDPVETQNLYGVDPSFVNSASGDFHVNPGSAAIDQGDNLPPDGLSSVDLDFQDRIQGTRVDVGAYETGFGEGLCRALSFPPPPGGVSRYSAACRCVSDIGLRVNRCSFLLPDLVLVGEFPRNLEPFEAFDASWTIQVTNPDLIGKYSMAAEAQIDGKWTSQKWLGPSAKSLEDGTLVVEKFLIQPGAQGFTPLRTTIEYQRKDTQGKTTAILEVNIPEIVIPPPKQ